MISIGSIEKNNVFTRNFKGKTLNKGGEMYRAVTRANTVLATVSLKD